GADRCECDEITASWTAIVSGFLPAGEGAEEDNRKIAG
ncbi:hypothetical protein PARMER_00344, partial [Parabacteroides merdae ATCC 43184]